jgi:predicted dehydrogenase
MNKRNQPTLSRRKFLSNLAAMSALTIVPRSVLGRGFLPPSDKINFGFIGAGKQSIGLMRNFLSTGEVQFVAAADVYRAKLDNFLAEMKKFCDEKQMTGIDCTADVDFTPILERKDVDAVIIATPDHWHGVMAVRAAEAGKDVYCEKPLSLTVSEGRAMVNATRKNGRVFQTGSMQRSWPEFRQTAELIRNGYLGEIKEVKVSVGGPPVPYDLPGQTIPDGLDWDRWLGPNGFKPFNNDLAPRLEDTFWGRWRNYREFGGGGMTDWGAHMFDIVQWALDMDDSGPVSVLYPDGKDVKELTYVYDNGIPMTHENFGKDNAIRFIGTEGQLDVQRRLLETTPESLKDKAMGGSDKRVYFSDNHYSDFIKAIRNRTKPVCDVEIGHRTATVCNIGNIAYQLKRSLTWNPVKEKFKRDKEANALLTRELRKGFDIRL